MFTRNKNSGMPDALEALFDLSVFVVTVGLLLALRFQTAPVISPATFLIPGQEAETRDMPAFFNSVGDTIVALVTIDLKAFHPHVFAVQVDDCIERLAVNGVMVIPEKIEKICSPHDLTHLNLGPYLHQGKNSLSFSISDIGVTEGDI
jgi:hypothetical protein